MKKVSEYDQKIPQSRTANQPTIPRGSATENQKSQERYEHYRGPQGFWGSGENNYVFSGSWGALVIILGELGSKLIILWDLGSLAKKQKKK